MNKFKKIISLLLVICTIAVLFAACNKEPVNNDNNKDNANTGDDIDNVIDDTPDAIGGDPDNTPDDPELPVEPDTPDTPDVPDTPEQPDEPVVDNRPLNPLTGLPTDYDVHSRPYAIMFNNIKKSLPQYGISEADVYYEAVSEGNITRVMGLYLNATHIKNIGSIRSTRLYFLNLALGHDSILIHAGQSAETKKYMVENNIFTIDATTSRGSYFYRDQDRINNKIPYEHTLFLEGTSLDTLLGKLEKNGYRLKADGTVEHFYFNSTDIVPDGKKAENISVPFVSTFVGSFKYDPETQLYTKYQYGDEHYDELYDTAIKVKNVIIVYSDMSLIEGDEYGRSKVNFDAGGKGLYISNGKAVEITWSKDGYNNPIRYFNKSDMMPLYINRGKTYICLVSKNAAVSYS